MFFNRALCNTHTRCDLTLGVAFDFPQLERLSTLARQPVDGVGEVFQLLPTRNLSLRGRLVRGGAKGIKIIHSPNGHDSSAPQVSEDQRIGGLKQVGFGVEYVVLRCERRQNSIAFLNDIIGFDW